MPIPPTKADPARVLFVCMGNICRSPLGEGIFTHKVNGRGLADHFIIDSCGIGGWHEGELPDQRARATAERHGIVLPSRARQFRPKRDIAGFDLLIAMDHENRDALLAHGVPEDKVRMMLSFHPDPPCPEVPDPYYGGPDGFEDVYQMLDEACENLLVQLS